ncbi:MAG: norM [Anaerosporomusa subterranea]|jgi:MATE family multidrug resistance protein|nr:norM [Anaerosporomusa subterranea]
MKKASLLSEKVRQFLNILLPILITQLSLGATSFFDTVMSGNASQNDLAGVAIGANLWMPIFTGVNGVLVGITPILAQLHGAGKKETMPIIVMQGIYLAVVLTLLLLICGPLILTQIFAVMRLESSVRDIAYQFLAALSLGMFPLFVSAVLRNFIDALGYTRVTMIIALCALPINIVLNYLLIFGNFGFPRLGGAGAGYASAVTYWCILFISLLVVHRTKPFKDYRIFNRLYGVSLIIWKELLIVGIPIGFSIFCEVSIFGVVALLMAEFGTEIIAAHQAAINFASLIYIMPLSIGMALTIVIGFEVGAKRYEDARQYSLLGVGIAIAVALFFAGGLSLFSHQIAGLYTNSPIVLQLIQSFLAYAVLFQLSDAFAAPIQGALRGYKDVKVTLIMAIVSYWIIGMPTGYILAKYNTSPYGYWIGLITGLAVGAIVLSVRLIRLQKKYIKNYS